VALRLILAAARYRLSTRRSSSAHVGRRSFDDFNDSPEPARVTEAGVAWRAAALPHEPTRDLAEIAMDADHGAESPPLQGWRARLAGNDGSTPVSRELLAISEADSRYWFG